ncbi:MAG: hypothetical protein ACKVP0_17900 [Pirellulaceae bacterium]
MPDNLLDNLDVFYGELTPARATVYARLEGLENATGLSLSGFVRGPRCFYSTTLLSTYPLSDAGPGPSLVAKALVPDPCYWSPETPNIYDVTVELRRGQDIIASEVRQIGFKPLGISGRFFTWEGKPWVMRGIKQVNSTIETDIFAWRDQGAVLVGVPSSDELRLASEKGILVYCMLAADADRLKSELRRVSYHPAVFAFGTCYPDRGSGLKGVAPNVLLFFYGIVDQEYPLPHWASFGHIAAGEPQETAEVALQTAEPIVLSKFHAKSSLSEARAAADKLQADLAPYGQFAGYIV